MAEADADKWQTAGNHGAEGTGAAVRLPGEIEASALRAWIPAASNVRETTF